MHVGAGSSAPIQERRFAFFTYADFAANLHILAYFSL